MPDTTESLPLESKVGLEVDPQVARLRMGVLIGVLGLFFLVIPGLNLLGAVPNYKVQVLGKFLCFALVALGADLIWGYTGLLSLCQAMFFCIGGYAMAMHLALPEGGGDLRAEYNFIPQLFSTISVNELPGFWKPFASPLFAAVAGPIAAAGLATIFGFFIFRSRVRGVYFSILTQAVAWGVYLLANQGELMMGGETGIRNYNKVFSESTTWVLGLYLITCALVTLGYLVCRHVVRSRAGRILVAIRDKEMRLYFAGYKPHAFKVFVFALAAMLGAIGGMLYPPQVGGLTPLDMHVEASIFIVILVAVGGRGRLWGAVFGAVLLNIFRSALSTDMPSVWPFVYGGIFVAIVLFMPDGFVGLWDLVEQRVVRREGAQAILLAAAPIGIVSLFALLEGLGLMPAWMQKPVGPLGPYKYLLLIKTLGAISLIEWRIKSRATRRASTPGFAVKPVGA